MLGAEALPKDSSFMVTCNELPDGKGNTKYQS